MAFLGIKIPHPTARLLSGIELEGDNVSPSDMHITILHFENDWAISEMVKAMEVTYDIVADIKPFLIKVKNIICFPKRNEKCAIVAEVESKKLHQLQQKLAKKFDKKHIDFSKTFKDYKPHITLSYAKEQIKDFEIDTVEFSVPEIVIWGGDNGDNRIFITFPLQGPQRQKLAIHLLQKADIFQKLAKNPEQTHFSPSFERRLNERLL